MREQYNKHKNPLDLFVLIAFSFNHQIRFNNNHEYNNPFGRERSSFNAIMKQNLEDFIIRLKETNNYFSSRTNTNGCLIIAETLLKKVDNVLNLTNDYNLDSLFIEFG